MIVPVQRVDDNVKNWIAVELHGNLKSFSKFIKEYLIGDMYFKNNNDVILIIGSYILEGVQVTLEKPIVILEKKNDITIPQKKSCNFEKETYYTLHTIIKKKIVFRIRPKPIVIDVLKSK